MKAKQESDHQNLYERIERRISKSFMKLSRFKVVRDRLSDNFRENS